MEQHTLGKELHVLYTAMINSAYILYQGYSNYFKITLLLIIAYIGFKLGRATVTDPLDIEVKSINKGLTNRQHYTMYLPKKMKQLSKLRNYLCILLYLVCGIGGILFWMKNSILIKRTKQQLQIGGIIIIILILSIIGIWIYEKILSFILKRGGFNDHLLHSKLSQIITTFGKKTQFLLKGYLCRQKFLKKQNGPSNICSKDKCKQYRALLKQRSQVYAKFTDSVMNFQWCSICKKKVPFDEYLPFETRVYQKNEDTTEQKDVSQRNKFLLSQIERMSKWVHSISPCNCSRRYWRQSTNQIRQFKKDDKELKERLSLHQKTSPSK